MNCPFCKSFLLIFIQDVWRGVPQSTSTSHIYALFPFFSYRCALFCNFLHCPKSQLFSFQPIAHSSTKNTGVGYPPSSFAMPLGPDHWEASIDRRHSTGEQRGQNLETSQPDTTRIGALATEN